MENKDELIKVAKEGYHEFDDVSYAGTWKGYKIYSPFIKGYDGDLVIGYPIWVLEKEDRIRLNTQDESLVILRHINNIAKQNREGISEVKIKLTNHKGLYKSRSHLVKVAVQVNGRFGMYQSHRWKNPTAAFDILKTDLQKQGIKNPNTAEFIDKKDGKVKSQEEIISDYEKEGGETTIQEFVKNKYEVKAKEDKTQTTEQPKVRKLKEKTITEPKKFDYHSKQREKRITNSKIHNLDSPRDIMPELANRFQSEMKRGEANRTKLLEMFENEYQRTEAKDLTQETWEQLIHLKTIFILNDSPEFWDGLSEIKELTLDKLIKYDKKINKTDVTKQPEIEKEIKRFKVDFSVRDLPYFTDGSNRLGEEKRKSLALKFDIELDYMKRHGGYESDHTKALQLKNIFTEETSGKFWGKAKEEGVYELNELLDFYNKEKGIDTQDEAEVKPSIYEHLDTILDENKIKGLQDMLAPLYRHESGMNSPVKKFAAQNKLTNSLFRVNEHLNYAPNTEKKENLNIEMQRLYNQLSTGQITLAQALISPQFKDCAYLMMLALLDEDVEQDISNLINTIL